MIQSDECIRLFIANYFDDQTAERMVSHPGDGHAIFFALTLTALFIGIAFTNDWCCDRHPLTQTAIFTFWFTGTLFTTEIANTSKRTTQVRRKRVQVRPRIQRPALIEHLTLWRLSENLRDRYRVFRSELAILSDKGIKLVTAIASQRLSVALLVETLDETAEWEKEWASKILGAIQAHEISLEADLDSSSSEVESEDEESEVGEPENAEVDVDSSEDEAEIEIAMAEMLEREQRVPVNDEDE